MPRGHRGLSLLLMIHPPRTKNNKNKKKKNPEWVRCSTVSLAFFSNASGDCAAWREGFDVVHCGNNLFFFKEKDLGKHRCMSINRKRTKGLVCAHMTGDGFGSNLHVWNDISGISRNHKSVTKKRVGLIFTDKCLNKSQMLSLQTVRNGYCSQLRG